MYSSAVKASSLLLPLWRARNRYGNSTVESGCGDGARMSINTSTRSSRSTRIATLPRSLKVGTTMHSSGARGRTAISGSAMALAAGFATDMIATRPARPGAVKARAGRARAAKGGAGKGGARA